MGGPLFRRWERGRPACRIGRRAQYSGILREDAQHCTRDACGPRRGFLTTIIPTLGIRVRDFPAKIAWRVRYSVEELAKLCELKRPAMRYRWLVEFGCSPKQWLMRERAIYAGHLAEHADPTEEIAAQLGYTDASHFTRDFRRFYGMTTYQWRELCRRDSWRADGVRIRVLAHGH